ncbi:glycosyltransferase family 4 protein [Tahibacter amnicola]|uniref:Glycosyltransferase family 4 protein n=1 Tax=Tahibacter amnicola TaxID=2976241 RepID=A0ABY6BA24_9GAMM|nr:glycosyltransferase family 1 protein [Tahibacter amnicola]UXI66391.1 glycosyltransferase family 4 protein [Tahibacter amnicola]
MFRAPCAGGHSIEGLFRSIATAMQTHCEVSTYVLRGGWRLLGDIWRIRRLRPDIVHVTGAANHILPLLVGLRVVLTVHDIGHYLYTLRGWRRAVYRWLWMDLPYRLAWRLTTISTHTQEQLAKHCPATRRKTIVVHNCVSDRFTPDADGTRQSVPTVLQVGAQPHKNLTRIVEALKGTGWRLEILGNPDEVTRQLLENSGVDYYCHGWVAEEAVPELYRRADVIAFASLSEGFGMPIIEAQAMGRPVVTSHVTAMPEVAGKGACVVDPTDIEAIRVAIRRTIEDSAFRDQLVRDGLDNVRRFQPARIAVDYLAVYRSP